jgi:hypothetical protein
MNKAKGAVNEPGDWIEILARFGYAAKGIVYIIIGALALQAAVGTASPNINIQDALVQIVSQPFGQILLYIVGVGLAGYALWKFVQAILNPDREKSDAKGYAARAGYLVTAFAYGFLAYTAFRMASGQPTSGGGTTQGIASSFMGTSFGRWAIAAAGIILFIWGLAQFYRAYTASFMKHIDTFEMDRNVENGAEWLGRFGIAARGVVFLLIGYFLAYAGITYKPSVSGGLGQALATLDKLPYGPWLLGIVGAGLIAYGLFMIVLARYRTINV